MNFLAHLYLSDEEEILVGNFIGDFVKGAQMKRYSDKIQKGIRLHRSIDYFTDTHDVVRQSKIRLREKYRHYSPVIVDIYFDHFLAKDWDSFSKIPLKEYTKNVYRLMGSYADIIPQSASQMLSFMARDNWLYQYQFIEGIDRALIGMSKRTKYENKMDEASLTLKEYYQDFQEEFNQFFPDLKAHVNNFEK